MSDRLRETLRNAAGNEPSVGDPFERFARARRRSTTLRTGVTLSVVGAGLVMLLRVLPGPFGQGPGADFRPGGTLQPSPNTMVIYRDPVAGFEIRFPGTWHVRGAAGKFVEFWPDATGDDDAVLTVISTSGRTTIEHPNGSYVRLDATPRPGTQPQDRDAIAEAGARVRASSGETDGNTYSRFDILFRPVPVEPSRGWVTGPPARWCASCHTVETLFETWSPRWSLSLRAVSPDAKSAALFLGTAEKLVDSIRTYGPPDPSQSPVRL